MSVYFRGAGVRVRARTRERTVFPVLLLLSSLGSGAKQVPDAFGPEECVRAAQMALSKLVFLVNAN